MKMNIEWVWVFHGEGDRCLSSAVFSTLELAESWVAKYKLSGVLTRYPVDISVYDWALQEGLITIRYQSHTSPQWIQQLSSAHLEHYHYENGSK